MGLKVTWRTHDQGPLSLLPPSYDELVAQNHPVHIVNTILDPIDLSNLENIYHGEGTSSYQPKVLLKVLVWAYLHNLYSSRKIKQALYENIHFI